MKTMAFLNIEDIAICSLLESNYPVIRDEYNIFKKEYLYNKSREELTEDDSVHWDLCRKGYVDSIKAGAKKRCVEKGGKVGCSSIFIYLTNSF